MRSVVSEFRRSGLEEASFKDVCSIPSNVDWIFIHI